MDKIDVYFNGMFVGVLDAKEQATNAEIAKAAEVHFPRRNLIIKKFIYLPHKSISFIEKIEL